MSGSFVKFGEVVLKDLVYDKDLSQRELNDFVKESDNYLENGHNIVLINEEKDKLITLATEDNEMVNNLYIGQEVMLDDEGERFFVEYIA